MIFVMVYVSFDMVLGAYLVGSITALVVKGSKTEIYREKIKNLLKHMDKKVDRDVQNKIKYQLQLPYDSSPTDSPIFQDLPSSIRTMVWEREFCLIMLKFCISKMSVCTFFFIFFIFFNNINAIFHTFMALSN